METQFAVTLTGRVHAGVDVDQVWARAAGLLRKSPEAFLAEVRRRMPLSLKPVDEAQARRQAAALEQAGLEVALLPEQGERVWLHHEDRVCGPLSARWLEQALDAGSIPAQAKVRALAPTAPWIEASDWRAGKDLDLALDHDTPVATQIAAAVAPAAPADWTAAVGSAVPGTMRAGAPIAAAPSLDAGLLPTHYERRDLHGGFWLRFVAAVLDWLILYAGGMFVVGFVSAAAGAPFILLAGWGPGLGGYAGLRVLIFFIDMSVAWLYAALFQRSRLQASPGMLALGLRVTTLDGERIGFGRATGRYFATILSVIILFFGYFMIGWTQRKQALHDMMAGTLVVRKQGLARYRADIASGVTGSAGIHPAGGLSTGAIVGIVFAVLFAVLVPIVAILAAIAIPAYQNYIVRAQVSEGLAMAESAKTDVARFYANTARYPADNASAGLPSAGSIRGNYVAAVAVRDGNILVQYGNRANAQISGRMLMLAPQAGDGSISWSCQGLDLPRRYLPSSCRE
ncbi:MAG: pilin [Metallibacterium sp.]